MNENSDRLAEIKRLAESPLVMNAPPLTLDQQNVIALAFANKLPSDRSRVLRSVPGTGMPGTLPVVAPVLPPRRSGGGTPRTPSIAAVRAARRDQTTAA